MRSAESVVLLQGAPHTAAVVLGDEWKKPYSREAAAFPAAWVRQAKFWPTTGKSVQGLLAFGHSTALMYIC